MTRTVSVRLAVEDDEKVKAALRSMGTAGAEALAIMERGASRSAQSFRQLEQALDPAARAQAQMAAAQVRLNQALEAGHINAQRAAELTALARQRYQETGQAATQMAAGADQAAHAVRGLGIQSIDVFQQLASGAPVMTTFIQQGSQVAQQSAAMGVSLGTVARGAAAAVAAYAPLIAALGAVAAVGGATYAVFSRSNELASQQRTLSVAIQGVGRSAELSSVALRGYVRDLERQGVASAEALKSVADLSRNSALPPAMIGRIVGLGPDAAAALGSSVPDAIERMARAAKGTTDAIQELSDAFNLLTPAEEASVRRMVEHGERGEALQVVFDKLQQRVQGLSREALSPAEQAMRDMSNAWGGFVDRVANSDLVIGAIERIAAGLKAISRLMGPAAGSASDAGSIDAQIAALSGVIPGTNATAARLRREQAEALSRLYAQRQAAAQAAADAAEFGGGIPPAGAALTMPSAAGILGTPSATQSREIDRRAADVVAGTPGGTITRLTQHLREYRAELTAIQRGSDEWAARAPILQAAIEATNKAIEEARKKDEQHLDTLEKARAAYASQTRAQEELTAAHARGRDAVAQVLATREAEAKALEANLIPGTARYAAAVADLTTRIQARQQAEASAKVAERVQEANEAVEAQLRINAAYDATEASVIRAQNAEKALAEARRAGLSPNGAGFADQVGAIASAYDRAADASRAFQQAQSSVGAILGSIENAADRVGQALVDGFINGRNEAVTAASVARAAFSSLAADAAKLGVINPLVNSVLGTNRPTLWTGLNALSGGAVGGAAGAGNGGNGLFGSLVNAMSLGRLSDALGLTDFGSQLSGVGRFLGISGNNGLFSGVSSLLNTPAWGTVNPGTALLDSMGITAGMPGTGAPTLGQLFGGVGLGFSAGSLLGGVLQRTFNRTGPAPTIGAGLGAGAGALIGSFIPGVGTLLGGLAGGLFGGGAGSLIGPRPATPFSATGLTADASGLLSVGRTVSQIVDTTAEVAALTEQVQRVNAILAAGGARIANAVSTDEFNQARIVGGTSGTWLNFGQGGGRPGSLVDAFGELRFTANDPNVAAAVSGRAFGSLDDLAKVLDQIGKATSFLDDLVPTLTDLTERSTQFSDALKAVNDTYAEAITFARETAQVEGLSAEMAGRLRQAETDLIAARETASLKAVDAVLASVAAPLGSVPTQLKDIADSFNAAIADIQKSVGSSAAVTERLQQAEQALVEARDRRAQQVYDEAARSIYDYDASLNVRLANVTAEPGAARLFAADEQARLERQALDKTLVDQWGEAIRQTQAYADQFALLNQVLSAERGALERQNAEAVRRRTEDATDITRGLGVRITTANAALGFDEAAYLRANPDVARQVAAGAIASGWSHYQQYGRMEGRTGGAVSDMDARRATFDEQARLERQALDRQLVGLWGEQVRTTAGYTEQLANLNQALAAEWRAIEQQVANDNTSWRRSVYDPLVADTSPAGRLATEIETLTRSFAEAAEKARTLGLSEDALALARDRQIQGARDRMDLQGLQLIGRQQGVLTSFLDDLAFGPSVSPTDRLRASQDAFASAVGQARAGDVRTADLGAVTAAATRLLEAGRGFYATGPGQNSLEQMVRSTIESLGRTLDLPAFGGDIERSLRAAINPLTDELDALRQEVRELRNELTTRRVLGVAA